MPFTPPPTKKVSTSNYAALDITQLLFETLYGVSNNFRDIRGDRFKWDTLYRHME
ncbi:hypothetical protein WN55_05433 [Dufourea novaeangliae]|uniref:Uncharacterized protein n=1 Tax=Dufourea novaeangliae TaxID=178035 RepID=A0A154P0N8_DUFNO|nr:hypothetical protein WN55_05433 [Dufourea novaeangliae]